MSARHAPPAVGIPAPVLGMTGVSRVHGDTAVWQPVDVSLAPGTLSVVTGPNGSGKTTLLRMAAGLVAPTTGVRTCAGPALYLRAGAGLRAAQTLRDAVAVTAGLTGRASRSGEALELLGLRHLAHRRVGTLSGGERVRGTLAAAVACEPALLCLDEPTAALDERALADLAAVLDVLRARGTALLVATHQPAALLRLADAHLAIDAGRVVLR